MDRQEWKKHEIKVLRLMVQAFKRSRAALVSYRDPKKLEQVIAFQDRLIAKYSRQLKAKEVKYGRR